MPVPDHGCDRVLSIGKNVGLDHDALAGNTPNRKSSAFEFRLNPSNHHSLRRLVAHHFRAYHAMWRRRVAAPGENDIADELIACVTIPPSSVKRREPISGNVHPVQIDSIQALAPLLFHANELSMLQDFHMAAYSAPATREPLYDFTCGHSVTAKMHDHEDLSARRMI